MVPCTILSKWVSSFKFGKRDLYIPWIHWKHKVLTPTASIALRMCLLELLAAIPEEAANRKAQCRPVSCCGQVASTYLRSDHSRGSNDLARSNLHFGNCSRKEQFWRFDLHKDVLKVSYQVMVGAERRASFAASMLGSPADSLVMLIVGLYWLIVISYS